ncbi:MAG: hypothetical protein AB7F76_01700 [Parvibaculaceae bacterium]|jgi:hypothetical protein
MSRSSPKESTSARKARETNEAAWKIIDAERARHDAKTARLKAQREAAESATPKSNKSPEKAKKTKATKPAG